MDNALFVVILMRLTMSVMQSADDDVVLRYDYP